MDLHRFFCDLGLSCIGLICKNKKFEKLCTGKRHSKRNHVTVIFGRNWFYVLSLKKFILIKN